MGAHLTKSSICPRVLPLPSARCSKELRRAMPFLDIRRPANSFLVSDAVPQGVSRSKPTFTVTEVYSFFNNPATTETYTLSLHDAGPSGPRRRAASRSRLHT